MLTENVYVWITSNIDLILTCKFELPFNEVLDVNIFKKNSFRILGRNVCYSIFPNKDNQTTIHSVVLKKELLFV